MSKKPIIPPTKQLACHFWCLDQCLLKINTKCNFDWNEFMKKNHQPSHAGGKKKLVHKVQIRTSEVLKNLRLIIERKEQK